ncbi:hypothetical protein BJ684DRAFT_19683, partial [Piptocephalis cylindrospora]
MITLCNPPDARMTRASKPTLSLKQDGQTLSQRLLTQLDPWIQPSSQEKKNPGSSVLHLLVTTYGVIHAVGIDSTPMDQDLYLGHSIFRHVSPSQVPILCRSLLKAQKCGMNTVRQKWALYQSYRKVQRHWETYQALETESEQEEALDVYLATFHQTYQDWASSGLVTQTSMDPLVDRVFGDCTPMLIQIIHHIDSLIHRPSDKVDTHHSEKLGRALDMVELLVREEKYQRALASHPTSLGQLLQSLQHSPSPLPFLRIIASLGQLPDASAQLGLQRGFRILTLCMADPDPDISLQALITLRDILRGVTPYLHSNLLGPTKEMLALLAPYPPLAEDESFVDSSNPNRPPSHPSILPHSSHPYPSTRTPTRPPKARSILSTLSSTLSLPSASDPPPSRQRTLGSSGARDGRRNIHHGKRGRGKRRRQKGNPRHSDDTASTDWAWGNRVSHLVTEVRGILGGSPHESGPFLPFSSRPVSPSSSLSSTTTSNTSFSSSSSSPSPSISSYSIASVATATSSPLAHPPYPQQQAQSPMHPRPVFSGHWKIPEEDVILQGLTSITVYVSGAEIPSPPHHNHHSPSPPREKRPIPSKNLSHDSSHPPLIPSSPSSSTSSAIPQETSMGLLRRLSSKLQLHRSSSSTSTSSASSSSPSLLHYHLHDRPSLLPPFPVDGAEGLSPTLPIHTSPTTTAFIPSSPSSTSISSSHSSSSSSASSTISSLSSSDSLGGEPSLRVREFIGIQGGLSSLISILRKIISLDPSSSPSFSLPEYLTSLTNALECLARLLDAHPIHQASFGESGGWDVVERAIEASYIMARSHLSSGPSSFEGWSEPPLLTESLYSMYNILFTLCVKGAKDQDTEGKGTGDTASQEVLVLLFRLASQSPFLLLRHLALTTLQDILSAHPILATLAWGSGGVGCLMSQVRRVYSESHQHHYRGEGEEKELYTLLGLSWDGWHRPHPISSSSPPPSSLPRDTSSPGSILLTDHLDRSNGLTYVASLIQLVEFIAILLPRHNIGILQAWTEMMLRWAEHSPGDPEGILTMLVLSSVRRILGESAHGTMDSLISLLPSYLKLLRNAYGMKNKEMAQGEDKEEEETGMADQMVSHWHYSTQLPSDSGEMSPSAVRVILARERVLGLLECLGLFLGKGMKGRRSPGILDTVYPTLYPILLASTPWCWDWEEVAVEEEGDEERFPGRRIKWEYAKGYETMLAELTLWILQSIFLSMEEEEDDEEGKMNEAISEGMKWILKLLETILMRINLRGGTRMSLEGPEEERGRVPQPPGRPEYPWFQYVVCGMLSSLFRHSRRVKRIFGEMGGMQLLLGILGSTGDPVVCQAALMAVGDFFTGYQGTNELLGEGFGYEGFLELVLSSCRPIDRLSCEVLLEVATVGRVVTNPPDPRNPTRGKGKERKRGGGKRPSRPRINGVKGYARRMEDPPRLYLQPIPFAPWRRPGYGGMEKKIQRSVEAPDTITTASLISHMEEDGMGRNYVAFSGPRRASQPPSLFGDLGRRGSRPPSLFSDSHRRESRPPSLFSDPSRRAGLTTTITTPSATTTPPRDTLSIRSMGPSNPPIKGSRRGGTKGRPRSISSLTISSKTIMSSGGGGISPFTGGREEDDVAHPFLEGLDMEDTGGRPGAEGDIEISSLPKAPLYCANATSAITTTNSTTSSLSSLSTSPHPPSQNNPYALTTWRQDESGGEEIGEGEEDGLVMTGEEEEEGIHPDQADWTSDTEDEEEEDEDNKVAHSSYRRPHTPYPPSPLQGIGFRDAEAAGMIVSAILKLEQVDLLHARELLRLVQRMVRLSKANAASLLVSPGAWQGLMTLAMRDRDETLGWEALELLLSLGQYDLGPKGVRHLIREALAIGGPERRRAMWLLELLARERGPEDYWSFEEGFLGQLNLLPRMTWEGDMTCAFWFRLGRLPEGWGPGGIEDIGLIRCVGDAGILDVHIRSVPGSGEGGGCLCVRRQGSEEAPEDAVFDGIFDLGRTGVWRHVVLVIHRGPSWSMTLWVDGECAGSHVSPGVDSRARAERVDLVQVGGEESRRLCGDLGRIYLRTGAWTADRIRQEYCRWSGGLGPDGSEEEVEVVEEGGGEGVEKDLGMRGGPESVDWTILLSPRRIEAIRMGSKEAEVEREGWSWADPLLDPSLYCVAAGKLGVKEDSESRSSGSPIHDIDNLGALSSRYGRGCTAHGTRSLHSILGDCSPLIFTLLASTPILDPHTISWVPEAFRAMVSAVLRGGDCGRGFAASGGYLALGCTLRGEGVKVGFEEVEGLLSLAIPGFWGKAVKGDDSTSGKDSSSPVHQGYPRDWRAVRLLLDIFPGIKDRGVQLHGVRSLIEAILYDTSHLHQASGSRRVAGSWSPLFSSKSPAPLANSPSPILPGLRAWRKMFGVAGIGVLLLGVAVESRGVVLRLVDALLEAPDLRVEEVREVLGLVMAPAIPDEVRVAVAGRLLRKARVTPRLVERIKTAGGLGLLLVGVDGNVEALRLVMLRLLGVLMSTGHRASRTMLTRAWGFEALRLFLSPYVLTGETAQVLLGLALDFYRIGDRVGQAESGGHRRDNHLSPKSALTPSSPSASSSPSSSSSSQPHLPKLTDPLAFPEILHLLFQLLQEDCARSEDDGASVASNPDKTLYGILGDLRVILSTPGNMDALWQHAWPDWFCSFLLHPTIQSRGDYARIVDLMEPLIQRMMAYDLARPSSCIMRLKGTLTEEPAHASKLVAMLLSWYERHPYLQDVEGPEVGGAEGILKGLVLLQRALEEAGLVGKVRLDRAFATTIHTLASHNGPHVRTLMRSLGVLDLRDRLVL